MKIRIAKKIVKECHLSLGHGLGRYYDYSEYQRKRATIRHLKYVMSRLNKTF